MSNEERRATKGVVEVRAADGKRQIGGYAAKFGTLSRNLGGFVETIDRGFFAKSEADGWPNVMARYNHEDDWLLGTSGAGTLRLSVDDTGLDYTVDPPASPMTEHLMALVGRGDVQRSSFAFYTFEDDWGLTEQGFPLRTLVSGQLVDVAPVNNPAYLDTSSGLRSLAENRGLPLEEVVEMAARNELRRILEAAPVVVDLGARSGDIKPEPKEQVDPTPPARVHLLRRELELKKPR